MQRSARAATVSERALGIGRGEHVTHLVARPFSERGEAAPLALGGDGVPGHERKVLGIPSLVVEAEVCVVNGGGRAILTVDHARHVLALEVHVRRYAHDVNGLARGGYA